MVPNAKTKIIQILEEGEKIEEYLCDFGITKNFRSEKTLIIRANNDKFNFKKIKNVS